MFIVKERAAGKRHADQPRREADHLVSIGEGFETNTSGLVLIKWVQAVINFCRGLLKKMRKGESGSFESSREKSVRATENLRD